jgi:hypothetical protein
MSKQIQDFEEISVNQINLEPTSTSPPHPSLTSTTTPIQPPILDRTNSQYSKNSRRGSKEIQQVTETLKTSLKSFQNQILIHYLFTTADSDANGVLSKFEVFELISLLNIHNTITDIQTCFEEFDVDNSNRYTFITILLVYFYDYIIVLFA